MATPPVLLSSLLLLPLTAHAQHTVKLGDVFHSLLFPSHELLGGFERVIDDVNSLDNTVNSCGKRQICEAMSLGQVIERSDGSLELEKGFLRQAVDSAGDVLFELSRPFLEGFGMGRVARREVSFTEFLVDIMDSAIIGVSRLLGGRTLSRQLEQISPVTELIQPLSSALGLIPKHFYGNIVDLVVDVTGLANRRSGGYGLVRSAGLGYMYGGGDDSVCQNLNGDIFGGGPHCDDDAGKFFPLAMLNPINNNELGKTVRLSGGEMNPLMDRSRNTNPTTHISFQYKLTDLLEPTKMLCRVDGVLGAVNGHVNYNNDPLSVDEGSEDYEILSEVPIRRVDMGEEIDMNDLDMDEKVLVMELKRLKNKMQSSRDGTKDVVKTDMTSQERFTDYCNEMNMKEIKEMLIEKHNITMEENTEETVDEYYEYYEGSGSGDYQFDAVVNVRTEMPEKKEQEEVEEEEEKQEDHEMTDIETIARIGDKSLLSEKLHVESGSEVETVQSLINTFQLETNGKVEKVLELDSKKGQPVLLIQFDNTDYRDAVLKTSRMADVRSSTTVRFRRPKVKDLKHVVNLVRRH